MHFQSFNYENEKYLKPNFLYNKPCEFKQKKPLGFSTLNCLGQINIKFKTLKKRKIFNCCFFYKIH